MYQNSVSTVKRWSLKSLRMRGEERRLRRIYLSYGSSEVGNTDLQSRVKDVVNCVKKLA